jgi:uncharacterized protein
VDRSGAGKDYIGYQALYQAALKGVVRAALQKCAALDSLPGDHHFYITFRTRTPGVQIADYLKDKFPDEMTIVIQHQYWDFEVHDDRFEIILKFNGVPQHLRIPFAAVTRFVDPSVGFGLPLEGEGAALAINAAPETPKAAPAAPAVDSDATIVSLDAFRRK